MTNLKAIIIMKYPHVIVVVKKPFIRAKYGLRFIMLIQGFKLFYLNIGGVYVIYFFISNNLKEIPK